MKARNKKSLNAAYKNRKNNFNSENIQNDENKNTITEGIIEKDVVMAVRARIKRGKEKLMVDAYGNMGLEEYLVGSEFEKLKQDNFKKIARKYYQKSCEKGHPLGQFAMALVYLQEVEFKDEKLGVEGMSKAAKAGCGPALFNKGMWLMEGLYGQKEDFKKANKMFHRALKDPVIKEFKHHHARTLVGLAKLRMNGFGCMKSHSAALKHYMAAKEIDPEVVDEKVLKQLALLVSISGTELQREADNRNRRRKVMARSVQYQPLGDWVLLYKYCGFDISIQPSEAEAQVSMDEAGLVEWMERVGAMQTLPEMYPAINEPLPPLECDRPGCDVTEETSGEAMKKCTECQAPYCGAACQRKDWPRHKPVCEAIQKSMGNELTDHELRILKQDKDLPEKLRKLGISMKEFDEVVSDVVECSHHDNSIPCGLQCFQEKGAGSQNKHGYSLVGHQSVLTDSQRRAAEEVGVDLSPVVGEGSSSSPSSIVARRNEAAEAANCNSDAPNSSRALQRQIAFLEKNPDATYCLFTPDNEAYDRQIILTNVMGQLFFTLMWNRLLKVPWGFPANKPLWTVYDLLQGSVDGKKYKTMLRNQLMAEFGADPLAYRPNS